MEGIDPLDALRLLEELRCHANFHCVRCFVPEAGWHQAVCLSPHELLILQQLLTGTRAARGTRRGGETRARDGRPRNEPALPTRDEPEGSSPRRRR